MSARVFAPAKINLTLSVGPPQADGRHPLESVVAFADVGDWVEAHAAEAFTLDVRGVFAGALAQEQDNLVLRAARLLADSAGIRAGAALTLEKNLPIASGIGGGSSDAAAALRALRDLWRIDIADGDLATLAARLGADVPICVAARSAFMSGTGEQFALMELPSFSAVLVNPLKPLPTGAVYAKFDELAGGASFRERGAPRWRDANEALVAIAQIGNDLEPAARTLCPEIALVSDALKGARGATHVALSGSGATVFALMQDDAAAADAAVRIAQAHPEWWVRAVRLGG